MKSIKKAKKLANFKKLIFKILTWIVPLLPMVAVSIGLLLALNSYNSIFFVKCLAALMVFEIFLILVFLTKWLNDKADKLFAKKYPIFEEEDELYGID